MRLALVTVAACASVHAIPPTPRDPAPVVDALAPALTFGPLDHVAARYDEPCPLQTDSAAFDDLVARDPARHDAERDGRLEMAAAELDDALVDFTVRQHGVLEANAHVYVGDTLDALSERLGDRLSSDRARAGIAGTGPFVAVVMRAPPITIESMPRWLPLAGRTDMIGTLDPRLRAPAVTVTHDDGVIEHPYVDLEEPDSFVATIECSREGTAWVSVEAIAAGDKDVRLALFPIACGERPATTYRMEPGANTRSTDYAHRVAAIVNRERAAAGLAPLASEPRATAAAEQYAARMLDSGNVDHELGGKSPTARLLEAGIMPVNLVEATLQAQSLHDAAEILLNDRRYLDMILRADVNHVGVGVAVSAKGELFVALELERIVPPVDVEAAKLDTIAQVRAQGAGWQKVDPYLASRAQTYANELAAGFRDTNVWPELFDQLTRSSFTQVGQTARFVDNLDQIKTLDLVGNRRFEFYAVGIAQSARYGLEAGRIVVVVLFGHHMVKPTHLTSS